MTLVPRIILVLLAAAFSAYHVFLGVYALDVPDRPIPVVIALLLYIVATILTLASGSSLRLFTWVAVFDLAVVIAIPLLVTSQLDAGDDNGHATWYVAAVGTLMTIVAVRQRQLFAWIGVGFLCFDTLLWAGPAQVILLGAVGCVAWVAVAVAATRALTRAEQNTRDFAVAERQAADWQAAQEAHVSERQFRLAYTYQLAAPLLSEIVRTEGELSERQRAECRLLESAMRDEIRGRRLLSDAVREQIMAARRRGSTVTLMDEGGVDDLDETSLGGVLGQLADALRDARAAKLIIRTAPRDSKTAITVVGLPAEGDDVELWLQIPRLADAEERPEGKTPVPGGNV